MTRLPKNPLISHLEVVKKGGMATLLRYGRQHYRDMVNKRWSKHHKKPRQKFSKSLPETENLKLENEFPKDKK